MAAVDPHLLAIDHLTRRIRGVCRAARDQGLGEDAVASALVYELAASIAYAIGDGPEAHAVVDFWAAIMKDQIRMFRDAPEHP